MMASHQRPPAMTRCYSSFGNTEVSREEQMQKDRRAAWLVAPAVLWLLLFVIGPLVIVVAVSVATRGAYAKIVYNFTLSNFSRAFDPLYLGPYWRTIWIATATTLLCVFVSYPVAYYLALRAPDRWKRPLLVLTVIPFWTSFLIRTYAWILLLRSEGVINSGLLSTGLVTAPLK